MRTKLEINIDSTVLSSSDCSYNFFLNVVGSINPETGQSEGGFREKFFNPSLVYGIAVHKFIDVMYKTGGNFPSARKAAEEAFAIPTTAPAKYKEYLRDPKHLIGTCYMTWTEYVEQDTNFEVIEIDGKPATEITFKLLFYEDDYIRVNLCGTIDTIGKIRNGCYAIRDWKTTSSWDNVGYFKYYELTKQLRIYRLALAMMAHEHPDSVLGKIGATRVGAFIDAIFLKTKQNEVKFGRSDVFTYSDAELIKIRELLQAKCVEFSRNVQENHFPQQGIIHDTCEKKFGKCKFWNVCAKGEQVGSVLLKRDFEQKNFDPLKYQDT